MLASRWMCKHAWLCVSAPKVGWNKEVMLQSCVMQCIHCKWLINFGVCFIPCFVYFVSCFGLCLSDDDILDSEYELSLRLHIMEWWLFIYLFILLVCLLTFVLWGGLFVSFVICHVHCACFFFVLFFEFILQLLLNRFYLVSFIQVVFHITCKAGFILSLCLSFSLSVLHLPVSPQFVYSSVLLLFDHFCLIK